MSIVMTLSKGEFVDRLMGDEYANWSYDATKALYDYYNELSDSTGEPVEFDRVAIRCDWNEFDHINDVWSEYNNDETDEFNETEFKDWLNERTTLIELDNGHVLVEAF